MSTDKAPEESLEGPHGCPFDSDTSRSRGLTTGQSTPTEIVTAASKRISPWRIAARLILMAIGGFVLYGLTPQLIDLWSQVPELRTLKIVWFTVMILAEMTSIVSAWWLVRIALPRVSWFVAGTSQLVANAVSKVVPGGAAMGAASQYRMLATAGVDKPTAATALTANSIISNGVLLALPMLAVVVSILGAPIPHSLGVVAWGGTALFILLFAVVFIFVKFDGPLNWIGAITERTVAWVFSKIGRKGGPTAAGMVRERDQMVSALGDRWWEALLAAVGNWTFDYLALVAALYAVGAQPKLSLVLLAFGAAAVLGMIPITPGGLGFVEAGLTGTLVIAGVASDNALLATLGYRVVSYWLPLPAGLLAHFLFRARFRNGAIGEAP